MEESKYLVRVEQLDNWGRWAAYRLQLGSNRCGSIENRYVAPREDAQKLEKYAAPRIRIDEAEHVERAICLVPAERHRWVIVGRFAKRWGPDQFRQALGMRRSATRDVERIVEARTYQAVEAVSHAYEADESDGRPGLLPPLVLARLRFHMVSLRSKSDSDAYAFV